MGIPQFSQPVSGSDGGAVSTSITSTVETDNYQEGGEFSQTAYPFTVNPAETIEELIVFSLPAGQTVTIQTTSGTSFTVDPDGKSFVVDTLEIDSVTFPDDGNGGTKTTGMWAGQ